MAMLNFQQIKNGALVEAMLVSYQATKVLTTITKPDSDAVYTVEELLTLLKSRSESVTFENLETNLQEVIRTAATPEVFDPTSLVDAIEALQETQAVLYDEELDYIGGADPDNTEYTNFTLSFKPTSEKVKLFINGLPYVEDAATFTVDREATPVSVTWTMTPVAAQEAGYYLTEDTAAQAGKTYYSDANGTAVDPQPAENADITGLNYYEHRDAVAGRDGFNIIKSEDYHIVAEYMTTDDTTATP